MIDNKRCPICKHIWVLCSDHNIEDINKYIKKKDKEIKRLEKKLSIIWNYLVDNDMKTFDKIMERLKET